MEAKQDEQISESKKIKQSTGSFADKPVQQSGTLR